MNPRRRNRRIARTAKYTVPVGEHAPGGSNRFNRKGQVKKGYKMTGSTNTSGRIPVSTVAVPKKLKRRSRTLGGVTASGKGITKYVR